MVSRLPIGNPLAALGGSGRRQAGVLDCGFRIGDRGMGKTGGGTTRERRQSAIRIANPQSALSFLLRVEQTLVELHADYSTIGRTSGGTNVV
jgi:hypothetical protein